MKHQLPPFVLCRFVVCAFFLLFILSGCQSVKSTYYGPKQVDAATQNRPSQNIKHQIYLLGDAGVSEGQSKTMKVLSNLLDLSNDDDAVIFLGDNIYPSGMPAEGHKDRAEAEANLVGQLAVVRDFEGKVVIVPGNHDWEEGSANGKKAVNRQQAFVESYLDKKDVFVPENACGDVDVERLSKNVVILGVDSQWYLQNWNKTPGMNDGCEIRDRREFLDDLADLLGKYEDDQVIIAMHHPLFSNGNHGGKFGLKQHLFPLTDISKGLFVPLPVIGSLYPTYRSTTGHPQDIPHQKYQSLKKEILAIMKPYENVVLAAGHEHSLQYFNNDSHHFIISGSAAKSTYARAGLGASFVSPKKGFARLTTYEDRSMWLEFILSESGEVVFANEIVPANKRKKNELVQGNYPNSFADSITVVASDKYARDKGTFWLGEQYRDAWSEKISVPILNLEDEHGGLTVVKPGGGMSTLSLRLENEDDQQYVLRTVDKGVALALPEFIHNTWAVDISQDQISAIHPYSSVVIPALADAAKIYHTNPKIVFVPKQKNLGVYNENYGDQLYLYEERPAKNRSDVSSFGFSKEIISYRDLLKEKQKDNDVKIDQKWVLRSRLFDMFINDWDRHDDQWRWAKFKIDGEEIYRPIPRDRDQAFYKFEGFLPWLASRNFAIPKFQSFSEETKNIEGWNFNARYFDRYFLTELTEEDWQREIKFLQTQLTDEVIEQAFDAWPNEIQTLNAADIISILKARRDNLNTMGMKHYRFLTQDVNIVGSDKKELFVINGLGDGKTEVKMFKKNRKTLLYHRVFSSDDNREIRLYGLDGNDEFSISGVNSGSKIRIVGGSGEDKVDNNSTQKVLVYDSREGMQISGPGNTFDKRANQIAINEYDRSEFKYNKSMPLLNIGSNPDDGILLGAGTTITTHGFKSQPYQSKYTIKGNTSLDNNAFNIFGSADLINLFNRGSGIYLEADVHSPEFRNFYGGFGNAASYDSNIDDEFYWTRLKNTEIKALYNKVSSSGRSQMQIGPVFQANSIETVSGRITVPASSVSPRNYYGGLAHWKFDGTDNKNLPSEGGRFYLAAKQMFTENDASYSNLMGNVNLYFNIGEQRNSVIAFRLGGDYISGDYEFYHSPTLGGNNYLRGYRKDRFNGERSLYQNLDFRTKLFRWKNRVIPTDVGLIAGIDNGRVWYPGQNLDSWQSSYTGGLYFTPFDVTVVSTNYSIVKDDPGLFSMQVGFFF